MTLLDSPSKAFPDRVAEAQTSAEAALWVVEEERLPNEATRTGRLVVRPQSSTDHYNRSFIADATSVLTSFLRLPQAEVIRASINAVEKWLPEVEALLARVELSVEKVGAIPRQVARLKQFMGLTDDQLAAMFPVSRETVNRWHNRPDVKLTPQNTYRLGLLMDLAEAMKAAGIDARTWLHQPVKGRSETPYDLICAGRLVDVRHAVEAVRAKLHRAAEPMQIVEVPRGHDIVVEDNDDDTGWVWEQAEDD